MKTAIYTQYGPPEVVKRQAGVVSYPDEQPGGCALDRRSRYFGWIQTPHRPALRLDDIVEAYRYVETGQKTGNVILRIS